MDIWLFLRFWKGKRLVNETQSIENLPGKWRLDYNMMSVSFTVLLLLIAGGSVYESLLHLTNVKSYFILLGKNGLFLILYMVT